MSASSSQEMLHPARIDGRRRRRRAGGRRARNRRADLSRPCARWSNETIATLNGLASAATTASPSCCRTDRRWPTAFVAIASGATTAPLNPGLPRRRIRILSVRPQGQGAGGRARQHVAGDRGRAEARHDRSSTLRPDAEKGAGSFTPDARRRMAGSCRRSGFARAGRHRAGAAHLGHHLAAEDRAAVAAQRLRLGRQHRARRWRSRRTIAASTSCRCSTSTA